MKKEFIFNQSSDYIAAVAPAGFKEKNFKKLHRSINILKKLNFKVCYEESNFSKNCLPFFAASKNLRSTAFKNALLNPEVKIIWAACGGYGSTEIIFDCLNLKFSCSKILLGFSDITALHLMFNQHFKIPTIHSSSLISINKKVIFPIIEILQGENILYNLTSMNVKAENADEINGSVIGGNLTLLCNLLGTKLAPVIKNKILILEDINESGYKIHRNLVHLHNSNMFKDVYAIIFGDFSGRDRLIMPAIEDFVKNYLNIPVFRLNNFGHGKINNPVILGWISSIKNQQLTCQSPFRTV